MHSANCPIAPLEARSDVVPWSVLTDVKTKTEKNKVLPDDPYGQYYRVTDAVNVK